MDEMKNIDNFEGLSREQAREFVEKQMGKRWADGMSDEEIEKVIMVMWNVVHRQVTTIWEAVKNSITNLALQRAAEKGITYEEAIEEIHAEIKKGDE